MILSGVSWSLRKSLFPMISFISNFLHFFGTRISYGASLGLNFFMTTCPIWLSFFNAIGKIHPNRIGVVVGSSEHTIPSKSYPTALSEKKMSNSWGSCNDLISDSELGMVQGIQDLGWTLKTLGNVENACFGYTVNCKRSSNPQSCAELPKSTLETLEARPNGVVPLFSFNKFRVDCFEVLFFESQSSSKCF